MANVKDKNSKEEKNLQNLNQEQDVGLCDGKDCYCSSAYESSFLQPFWSDLFWDRPFRKEMSNLQNLMRTDIQETEIGYEFKVEVPGIERKDLNIGFESGYLTIAVNKMGGVGQNKFLRRERVTSASSRSFYVGDIDQAQIKASLRDGILTVSVPKEIKSQRYQIEIK